MLMTPEVSHAPMSSLKDAAAELQDSSHDAPQNNSDMSVTPPVAHEEMWPYIASVADWSANQAATAVLMLSSVSGATVGAGVAVGSDVGANVGSVGAGVKVGAGVDVGANVGGCVGAGVQYVGALVVGMELGAARATSQISR